MQKDQWSSLVAMFFDQADAMGDRPFLWGKNEGVYQPVTWRAAAEEVRRMAGALVSAGLNPGDRVMLVSENSPRWAMADLAIMAAGGITVPVYTTNTARDHLHILTDSGAAMAFVSTPALAGPFLEAALQVPAFRLMVAMSPMNEAAPASVAVSAWEGMLAEGEGAVSLPALRPTDTACIIYTSGTGGAPKGVVLSHKAIFANCLGAHHLLLELGLDDEVFLSFLPLSHSYEHTCGLMFPISIGAEIYYAEGVETLSGDMLLAKPTIMTAVPRLYEVMRQKILVGLRRAGGLKRGMFEQAVALGRKAYEDPASLTLSEKARNAVLERLVRDKVRARFGGRLKALVSGGAPLNPEVGLFFTALGMRLLQGYGQTEAAPVVSCNPPSGIRIHTVGPPLKDVEVRIADDGEILVRGDLLMTGYWNDPDASSIALADGWLHTGDIGVIDPDGYLEITDRKKDIIVNSGGDNISPQRVEAMLTLEPEIGQAMVFGDRRPHLVALIVPDESLVTRFVNGQPVSLANLCDDPAFREAVKAAVDRANANLSVIERVKRFAIADEPFTTANAQMTPTLKIRRHEILKRYRDTLEDLY